MPWIYQCPRAQCQASNRPSINIPSINCTWPCYNTWQHWATDVAGGCSHYFKDELFYFRVMNASYVSVLQITLWFQEINSLFLKSPFFNYHILFKCYSVILNINLWVPDNLRVTVIIYNMKSWVLCNEIITAKQDLHTGLKCMSPFIHKFFKSTLSKG